MLNEVFVDGDLELPISTRTDSIACSLHSHKRCFRRAVGTPRLKNYVYPRRGCRICLEGEVFCSLLSILPAQLEICSEYDW